jgi:hypothetical protein
MSELRQYSQTDLSCSWLVQGTEVRESLQIIHLVSDSNFRYVVYLYLWFRSTHFVTSVGEPANLNSSECSFM